MPTRFVTHASTASAAFLLLVCTGTTLGGGHFPPIVNLSTLNGANGFRLVGVNADDLSGWAVSSAGDVNDDGFDDLLIGAHDAEIDLGPQRAGETYVVFGTDDAMPASIDLQDLDGTNGFVIYGTHYAENSGWDVAGAGDVNQDGYDDILIGAPWSSVNGLFQAGAAYVVLGGPGVGSAGSVALGDLDGSDGFVMIGTGGAYTERGKSVTRLGDINDDGYDDVAIGTPKHPNGTASGKVWVVFGDSDLGDNGFVDLDDLGGIRGFTVEGMEAGDELGYAISGTEDVNGDFIPDVIIGSWQSDIGIEETDQGMVLVIFGTDGVFSASYEASDLDGTNGFRIVNSNCAGDRMGNPLSSGDVNDDGYNDIIVGAYGTDLSGGSADAGVCYVIFGGENVGNTGSISTAVLEYDSSVGFILVGRLGDFAGRDIASGFDINHDGYDDILVFVPNDARAYIVYGGATIGASHIIELDEIDGSNGFAIELTPFLYCDDAASAGDFNGDLVDDLVIGVPTTTSSSIGNTYVLFGNQCAGDINGDGKTNNADFNILAAHFNQSVTPYTNGDLNGNGQVTMADFNILAGDSGCPDY